MCWMLLMISMSRASARIYVGHISSRTRESDLERTFSKYGRIVRCDLKNGYAFIEFSDERDAGDAVRDMDGRDLDGSRVIVEWSRGHRPNGPIRPPMRSDNRVRVSDLSPHTSWQDLKDFARAAGNVLYTDVFIDRGKRYGVIEFSSRGDVREAMYRLDDSKLGGVRVRVREDDGSFDDLRSGGKDGSKDGSSRDGSSRESRESRGYGERGDRRRSSDNRSSDNRRSDNRSSDPRSSDNRSDHRSDHRRSRSPSRSTRETFSSSPGSPLEKRAKTAGRSPAQKNGSSLNGGASTSSGHVRRDSSFSQDDR
mmetsp:Transcript_13787/g.22757  ORF Transcript_13787/g.22757 Transcript_13787/m.22757 type:complete len:310 (-) Transcript_13787:1064-1993(-)